MKLYASQSEKSAVVQEMAWCLKQQAITYTHVDQVLWCYMMSQGHNELTHQADIKVLASMVSELDKIC